MQAAPLSTTATEFVSAMGNSARNAIEAWRAGGERMAGFLEQRWDEALEQSRPQLSEEVVANVRHTQHVVGSYYARGLSLTTTSAGAVVDQLVSLADQGLQQVAALASQLESRTGTQGLQKAASVAAPAAQALGTLAGRMEQATARWADWVGHAEWPGRSQPRTSAFRKARARKAA